MALIFQRYL